MGGCGLRIGTKSVVIDQLYEKIEEYKDQVKEISKATEEFKAGVKRYLDDVKELQEPDLLKKLEMLVKRKFTSKPKAYLTHIEYQENNQKLAKLDELEKKLKHALNKITEMESESTKKIEQLEEERDDAVHQRENYESEVEALQEQIELLNEIQKENEQEIKELKAQLAESDTTSKGDLKKLEEEKSQKDILAEKLKLDLSNIDNKHKELLQEKGQLSDRLNRTLDEYNALSAKNEALESSLHSLQKEKDSLKMENDENLEHVKGTLITFLQNTPFTTKENESVLSVVFSMLGVDHEQAKQIEAIRKKHPLAPEKKNSGKGSLFGMFGKK